MRIVLLTNTQLNRLWNEETFDQCADTVLCKFNYRLCRGVVVSDE
ncbi:Uncharacterised protein [Vibrio cholerae]|nr:Uncharacterised protein [Vibrio cholerae]